MSQQDQKTLRVAATAVRRLICGESLEAVSRDLCVPAQRLSEWRDRFLCATQGVLVKRERSPRTASHARAEIDIDVIV